MYWLQTGAQPTDTTRSILSSEGVCLKKHLLEGVQKGAFNEEAANAKFDAWLETKRLTTQKVKDQIREKKKEVAKARLDAEKEINNAKLEELRKKNADMAAALEAKAREAAAEAAKAIEEITATAEAKDEPVIDEPAVDEPVVEETAVAEPVVDEPAVAEPVVDEPAVAEPVVDEPIVAEPAVTEPAATDESTDSE